MVGGQQMNTYLPTFFSIVHHLIHPSMIFAELSLGIRRSSSYDLASQS